MLISLNWIRDFVELPADTDPRQLAERLTLTCCEVEDVRGIRVGAVGLCAARVEALHELPGTADLRRVTLDRGADGRIDTVTAAPGLTVGAIVVYAPPGTRVAALGRVGTVETAGGHSAGMIVPAEALGIALAAGEAVCLPPRTEPGAHLDDVAFDDWVIEIDNKSITHRPDLWGHYGLAREIAAMYRLPLAPYPMAPLAELNDVDLPEIPIEIDEPARCPRYSGLRITGVTSQPGPLQVQLRLGHVGMRPVNCLVDLTNYIMAELGQPMHAFDGDLVQRIEVGRAEDGEVFTTLDGVERHLSRQSLMIKSDGRNVALAGVMGGAETEVTERTRTLLLESANFEPATIRRCALALGMRTEASTRFEKSLDPENTVAAIRRFVLLARREFPGFAVTSRCSDRYPGKAPPVTVEVDPDFVNRFMGHTVERAEMRALLTALEFGVEDRGDRLRVTVPSFRATKDVSIEADVIEEIARYVGFNNIAPAFPRTTVRAFAPHARHALEQDTLRQFCLAAGYREIQGHLWYDASWLDRLGHDPGPCVTVRNPAASGLERLRRSLMPGILAAAELGRHHSSELKLLELGSVFGSTDGEARHVALLAARRGKSTEDQLLAELKGDIETWALQVLRASATFCADQRDATVPWMHPSKLATVHVGETMCGRVSVVPGAQRRRIDEHLAAWSLAWAEIELGELATLSRDDESLSPAPAFPQVELDFSVVADAGRRFADLREELARFDHELLDRITFVDSYEGTSLGPGRRSVTLRARIGAADRTLVEADITGFREAFARHLTTCGLDLRK